MLIKEHWICISIIVLLVIIILFLLVSKKRETKIEGYILPDEDEMEDEDEMILDVNPLEPQKGPSFWDSIDEMQEEDKEISDILFRPSEQPEKKLDIPSLFKEGGFPFPKKDDDWRMF